MLYDIVPMPFRYQRPAEISSVVPVFRDEDGIDDVRCYGWDVDVVALKSCGLQKYKTVEISGNSVVERVFCTTEPIDLSKKWWTSDISVMPVVQRIYEGTELNGIKTAKFLHGITDVLRTTGIDLCCPRTIHDHILRTVTHSPYWTTEAQRILRNPDHIAHSCVFGDDVTNVDVLERVKSMRHDPDYLVELPYIREYIPDVKTDPFTRMFSKENVNLTDLKSICALNFGVPMCSVMVASMELPFDITGSDVKYGESDPDKRWGFLMFLRAVEEIEATDFAVTLEIERKHEAGNPSVTKTVVNVSDSEMYNRYKGYGTVKYINPYHVDELLNMFSRWYWHDLGISTRFEKLKIRITRNWLDEVFIEVDRDGSVDRYYVDLTMYAIGSLGVMDQQG